MFEFIKKMFVLTMSFSSINALNAIPLSETPLKRISMNNKECRIKPEIIYINSK